MPIRIPDALPATAALEEENIFVMTEHRAMHQDIRPLRVLLLNLMPTKITTETQILRKLSNTPIQVEVELLQTASHDSKNTAAEHSGGLLYHLRRGARRALRRPYHHRRAGGAAGIRGGGLLAGALRDHGVVEDPRALHAAHLLGRPGRHLLPLRRAQARAAREDVRRVSPRGGQAHLAARARVRRRGSSRPTRASPRYGPPTSRRIPRWS